MDKDLERRLSAEAGSLFCFRYFVMVTQNRNVLNSYGYQISTTKQTRVIYQLDRWCTKVVRQRQIDLVQRAFSFIRSDVGTAADAENPAGEWRCLANSVRSILL